MRFAGRMRLTDKSSLFIVLTSLLLMLLFLLGSCLYSKFYRVICSILQNRRRILLERMWVKNGQHIPYSPFFLLNCYLDTNRSVSYIIVFSEA